MPDAIPIKRPLWRRLLRGLWKKLLCAVGAVLIIYAVMAWRYFSGTPTVARNVSAEINARIETTPAGDRAWPLYVDALSKLEPLKRDRDVPEDEDLAVVWRELRPGDELWPRLTGYLDRNEGVVAAIRAAADKPAMGFLLFDELNEDFVRLGDITAGELRAPSPNPLALDLKLGQLGYARRMGSLLIADAFHSALRGDGTRAAADLASAIAISHQLREHRIAIVSFVSAAILEAALHAAGEILAGYPGALREPDLIVVRDALLTAQISIVIDDDSLVIEDMVQRCYTDDGNGDGRITPEGWRFVRDLAGTPPAVWLDRVTDPGLAAVVIGRQESLAGWYRVMNLWEAERSTPAWIMGELKSEEAMKALENQDNSRRVFLLDPFALPFAKLYVSELRLGQERDAALTAIALARHRLRHGRYPASLGEFLLPEVPLDRMDGQPFRYRVDENGPLLYSVGADGDDDGGALREGRDPTMYASFWQPPSRRHSAADCDWILWPPPNSPPESEDP